MKTFRWLLTTLRSKGRYQWRLREEEKYTLEASVTSLILRVSFKFSSCSY